MAQTVPIVLTLLAIVSCLLVFGLFSVKSAVWKLTKRDATFWGAGIFHSSPAQITEKYPLNIYPAPWAISIIWPVILFWNVAAIIYLLYRRWSSKPLFYIPMEVFILWTIAWVLTSIWTFLFDGEVHLFTAACVLIVTACAFRSFYRVAKLYELHWKILAKESTTGRAQDHMFCYLVIESLAILTTWSVCALGISVGYGLAYQHSRSQNEAALTGILTPDESATIGAIIVLCYFLLWMVLDLTYWIERSDCVRSLYPGLAIILLFLGLSNSNRRSGMSLNNVICYALTFASTIAFFARTRAKSFFAQRRYEAPMIHGSYRD